MIDPKTLAESGVLLVDKPVEWTSHDVVNCVRRRFRVKKVGHCGTLDPNATGLLVVVLGKATKLSEKLSGQDKTYEGILRLGAETSTQDREGEVTATGDPAGVTQAAIEAAFDQFRGELSQIPPMVSAIKKDGKPLYKLARKGIEVEREPRQITIHELELLGVDIPDVRFRVRCSKGTYVRTLCADIGRLLGCGGHLYELRRLQSGRFDLTNCHSIAAIKTWEREQLLENMIPLARIFPYL